MTLSDLTGCGLKLSHAGRDPKASEGRLMRVNFQSPILGLDGQPVKDVDGSEMTLSIVATAALLGNYEDERGLSGDEKARRFLLATRIHGQGDVELKVEEVALLKSLTGKAFLPLVVGRAYELLDPMT